MNVQSQMPTISRFTYIRPIQAAVAKTLGPAHPAAEVVSHVLAAQAAATASRGVAPSITPEDVLNVERSLKIAPQSTLSRWFRTVLLGGTVSGTTITFSPQKDCVPMRYIVPAADASKAFSSLEAGLEQYFASKDSVAGVMFGANMCATYLRPIVTQVGQDITVLVSAAPTGKGHMLVAADLSENGQLSPLGELRPMGFTQVVAAGADATVTLSPQKDFKVRKLSLTTSTGVAALAGVTINQFLVGVEPQFLSSAEVSCEAFDGTIPWELWLDGDWAQIGQEITIRFHNYNVGDITVIGVLEGDVIR